MSISKIDFKRMVCILSAVILFTFLPAVYSVINARVAPDWLIKVSQPDGDSINIKISGNFRNHIYYSEDGYPLEIDEKGFYTFADIDKDNRPCTTGIKVTAKENRSQQTISVLEKIDKQAVVDAILKRQNERFELNTRGPGLCPTTFPREGEQKSIAILVEFQDREFTVENPGDYYYRMLNEENFSDNDATGSARDYYVKNSSGKFLPTFDVYGPVKLENEYKYYGSQNDRYAYKMVTESCEQLDDIIDFTQYDCDHDGVVDNIYIFYAGYGEADGGGTNTVWPHSWDIEEAGNGVDYIFDSVRLNHYACSNELQHGSDRVDGIGSFCHEFGHVLGLPDLYSTNFSNSFTPGSWDIMDYGSYNNHSRTPPNFSSFERYALDWLTPTIIDEEGDFYLSNLGDSNEAFIIKKSLASPEYYLFENRQQTGFDTYIPWHGMLVWHIDYAPSHWNNNEVNNASRHQYVDLIEADNRKTAGSLRGDPFPGTEEVTEFTCESKPAFRYWDDDPVKFEITGIKETDGLISFTAVNCIEEAAIGTLFTPGAFTIEGNRLLVTGNPVKVYNLAGTLLYQLNEGEKELPGGIYFITDGKNHQKVIIK